VAREREAMTNDQQVIVWILIVLVVLVLLLLIARWR
jgi:hypothetical protein